MQEGGVPTTGCRKGIYHWVQGGHIPLGAGEIPTMVYRRDTHHGVQEGYLPPYVHHPTYTLGTPSYRTLLVHGPASTAVLTAVRNDEALGSNLRLIKDHEAHRALFLPKV